MKLKSLVFCVPLVLFVSSAQAQATTGRLATVDGEVWVKAPGGADQKAQAGNSVDAGTQIRTGKDGQVEVAFDDGSTLRLQAGSQIVLSAHDRKKEKKNSVVLFFGRMWSKVTHSSEGRRNYEVKTPNAVCGVRGTEFETAVADDGSVRVRVAEGQVGVAGDSKTEAVDGGEEVEADEDGVDEAEAAEKQAQWDTWQKKKRERLRTGGRSIVDKIKAKILSRKGQLEALRTRQKKLETKRERAEDAARGGDRSALDEIRSINDELAEIADAIADLGDEAESQFGIVDHFADLASDPRFGMVDRKYLEAEAASLRRVKATLDAMVKEGTDISIKAMDQLMQDMRDGKTDSLRDKDSAADDLFGGDDMEMQ